MDRRFTRAEKEQIKTLVSEGLTNKEIAERLNRTEAAVRNIRYRSKLKTATQNQLPLLIQQKINLTNMLTQLNFKHTQLDLS